MKLNILAVGKTKDEFVNLAEKEYLKRLQSFLTVNLIVIPINKITPKTEIEKAKNLESDKILKRIPERSYVIALDENGKSFTSLDFANHLNNLFVSQNKPLYFIIGGPYGLANSVKCRYDELFSLSKMTFTHQMIRIILLEQIYRAMTIIKGKKYHY